MQDVCAICLTPIWNNKPCALQCGHIFHKNCVIDLLYHSSITKCPTCKAPIDRDQGIIELYVGGNTQNENSIIDLTEVDNEPSTSTNVLPLLRVRTNDVRQLEEKSFNLERENHQLKEQLSKETSMYSTLRDKYISLKGKYATLEKDHSLEKMKGYEDWKDAQRWILSHDSAINGLIQPIREEDPARVNKKLRRALILCKEEYGKICLEYDEKAGKLRRYEAENEALRQALSRVAEQRDSKSKSGMEQKEETSLSLPSSREKVANPSNPAIDLQESAEQVKPQRYISVQSIQRGSLLDTASIRREETDRIKALPMMEGVRKNVCWALIMFRALQPIRSNLLRAFLPKQVRQFGTIDNYTIYDKAKGTYFEEIDENGFLINGSYYKGGVIAFNDLVLLWNVQNVQNITPKSLEVIAAYNPPIDILFIGTGKQTSPLPAETQQFLKENRITVETMSSSTAACNFNFLHDDNQRVAVALIPEEETPIEYSTKSD